MMAADYIPYSLQGRQKETATMTDNITINITIEITYRITAWNDETGELMEWSAVGEEEREDVERFLHDCRTVQGNYSVEQW
tara:strand:- start:307 stop:549 length:243 start_codon:yes stop_codon:yes gene_type:complete